MRHILFMRNEFGTFCAGCGLNASFQSQENCSLQNLRDEIRELYHWQRTGGEATNFTAELYRLFQKADPLNYQALAKAFPKHAAALTLWAQAEDEDEFYRAAGMGLDA